MSPRPGGKHDHRNGRDRLVHDTEHRAEIGLGQQQYASSDEYRPNKKRPHRTRRTQGPLGEHSACPNKRALATEAETAYKPEHDSKPQRDASKKFAHRNVHGQSVVRFRRISRENAGVGGHQSRVPHAWPVGDHSYTADQGHFVTKQGRSTGQQLREQRARATSKILRPTEIRCISPLIRGSRPIATSRP
jgi:hypothetical protein